MIRPHHPDPDGARTVDVLVVGGGQSGLAVGYHLRRLRASGPVAVGTTRSTASFVILDRDETPGGAWQEGWPSLGLFSPASFSSLPGWPMPAWTADGNPSASHVTDYLAAYEQRYSLPVQRPVDVEEITDPGWPDGRLLVRTTTELWAPRTVICATGTWDRPFWPRFPGMQTFTGRQLHTADYRGPQEFVGRRVLVVGGGNSAAQIAADLQSSASVVWAARRPPRYLPDDVDGRVLFEIATRAVREQTQGQPGGGVAGLGDVVAVASVRRARDELGMRTVDMPVQLTATGATWADGHEQPFDAIIWCTGFRPALRLLDGLRLDRSEGHPATRTDGMRYPVQASSDPRIFFVGYGDWCGLASATVIGVNRAARDAVSSLGETLGLSLR